MILLSTIESKYEISRDVIIADAINKKISLYFPLRGKWEKVSPSELKVLPNPLREYPSSRSRNPRTEAYINIMANARLTKAKRLHMKKEDLKYYLAKENDAKTVGEYLALAVGTPCPADWDNNDKTGIKKQIKGLLKKYPDAIGLCVQIMFTSARVNDKEIEWNEYSGDDIVQIAKERGIPRAIGREIYKQLPELLKRKK